MQHPAGTDMRTGLWVRVREESRAGGCHGDAGRWREPVVHSGWHGTSCGVLSRSLSRLICVCSVQATELHWSGSRGLTLQGGFKVTFLDGCLCGSASIWSICMCFSIREIGACTLFAVQSWRTIKRAVGSALEQHTIAQRSADQIVLNVWM